MSSTFNESTRSVVYIFKHNPATARVPPRAPFNKTMLAVVALIWAAAFTAPSEGAVVGRLGGQVMVGDSDKETNLLKRTHQQLEDDEERKDDGPADDSSSLLNGQRMKRKKMAEMPTQQPQLVEKSAFESSSSEVQMIDTTEKQKNISARLQQQILQHEAEVQQARPSWSDTTWIPLVGWEAVSTLGDGNCAFYALFGTGIDGFGQLYEDGVGVATLRREMAEEMRRKKADLLPLFTEGLYKFQKEDVDPEHEPDINYDAKYNAAVAQIKVDKEFVDDESMRLVAILMGWSITVHSKHSDQGLSTTYNQGGTHEVHLLNAGLIHYEALRRNRNSQEPARVLPEAQPPARVLPEEAPVPDRAAPVIPGDLGVQYLWKNPDLKTRLGFLNILEFLPLNPGEFKPMLAGLNKGGCEFYEKYVDLEKSAQFMNRWLNQFENDPSAMSPKDARKLMKKMPSLRSDPRMLKLLATVKADNRPDTSIVVRSESDPWPVLALAVAPDRAIWHTTIDCVRRVEASGDVKEFGKCDDHMADDGNLTHQDGTAEEARFSWLSSIAVDADGNVFVADSLNHRIRMIRCDDGEWKVSTIAGDGTDEHRDGDGITEARFRYPNGLVLNSDGDLLVSERFKIRVLTQDAGNAGKWNVSTLRTNNDAQFNNRSGDTDLVVGPTGDIYLWSCSNLYLLSRAHNDQWSYELLVPKPGAVPMTLSFFDDFAVAPDGVIYLTDFGNNCIRVLKRGNGGEWQDAIVAGRPWRTARTHGGRLKPPTAWNFETDSSANAPGQEAVLYRPEKIAVVPSEDDIGYRLRVVESSGRWLWISFD